VRGPLLCADHLAGARGPSARAGVYAALSDAPVLVGSPIRPRQPPTLSPSPRPSPASCVRQKRSSSRLEMGPCAGSATGRTCPSATSGTTISLVKRVSLLLALLALGCGASSSNAPGGSTTAKPLLAGDTCGVYADQQSCVGAGCRFAINTRPCIVGQPCPAGWCYAPVPTQPPVGPVASCACEGSPGDVCVLQLGGPAVQVGSPPSLSCRRGCQFFAPATPDEICSCVAQGSVERCWPSAMVQNLCDCDNGVR